MNPHYLVLLGAACFLTYVMGIVLGYMIGTKRKNKKPFVKAFPPPAGNYKFRNLNNGRFIRPQDLVNLLGSALEYDRVATSELINHRVECNDAMKNHPDIQVQEPGKVGVLGILNGLMDVDNNECITVTYDSGGEIITSVNYNSPEY